MPPSFHLHQIFNVLTVVSELDKKIVCVRQQLETFVKHLTYLINGSHFSIFFVCF